MSRTQAKCPLCGAIISVNDERENGFCTSCGKQIDVKKSIQLLEQSGQSDSSFLNVEPSPAKIKKKAPGQVIMECFELCSREDEFLGLRSKVMNMNVDDSEKAQLLRALDEATKNRLKDQIALADSYNQNQKSKEPVLPVVIFCIIIFFIGFAVSGTWKYICWGVGVFGIIGAFYNNSEGKAAKKEGKAAAELVERYRSLGYKI